MAAGGAFRFALGKTLTRVFDFVGPGFRWDDELKRDPHFLAADMSHHQRVMGQTPHPLMLNLPRIVRHAQDERKRARREAQAR